MYWLILEIKGFTYINYEKGLRYYMGNNILEVIENILSYDKLSDYFTDNKIMDIKTFLQRIEEWKHDYLKQYKLICLYGIRGWELQLEVLKFNFGTELVTEEYVRNYLPIMFIILEFGNATHAEQQFYLTFMTLQEVINSVYIDVPDRCITELTKNDLEQEFTNYYKQSYKRYQYNISKHELRTMNMNSEYLKYKNLISKINDETTTKVFRINDHDNDIMYYIIVKKECVYLVKMDDIL